MALVPAQGTDLSAAPPHTTKGGGFLDTVDRMRTRLQVAHAAAPRDGERQVDAQERALKPQRSALDARRIHLASELSHWRSMIGLVARAAERNKRCDYGVGRDALAASQRALMLLPKIAGARTAEDLDRLAAEVAALKATYRRLNARQHVGTTWRNRVQDAHIEQVRRLGNVAAAGGGTAWSLATGGAGLLPGVAYGAGMATAKHASTQYHQDGTLHGGRLLVEAAKGAGAGAVGSLVPVPRVGTAPLTHVLGRAAASTGLSTAAGAALDAVERR